jgi:ABC-type polysaccharide/polyol phosphate export permease
MTYVSEETDPSGAPATGERASSRRALGCAFEIVETLVLTLLIYLVIHNFVAQPFEVQQSSMVPTIVDGSTSSSTSSRSDSTGTSTAT